MTAPNGFAQWQTAWGSPKALFTQENHFLEAAFILALLLHLAPFGLLWHKKAAQAAPEAITLQNVDLIEPQEEQPPAPPPAAVEKPKSALDFIKMAIPIFHKAPEAPRDIVIPKAREPKMAAEPDKLIEKKMVNAQAAPEIKLDALREAPKVADLSKIPALKSAAPRSAEPALKLEEVGRRAAPPPQTPAISLDRSAARERAADISSLPKVALAPSRSGPAEKLVDRTGPAAYKPPATWGYQRRDAPAVSLDQPREVVRQAPKPVVQPVAPAAQHKGAEKIEISKEKVKITGPLSARKVLRSFVPAYPDWARAQNLEADVAIRFTVSPAGDVRDSAVVQRTSGYPDLDRLAMEALSKWKFSALTGAGEDQWGVITFRFLLD